MFARFLIEKMRQALRIIERLVIGRKSAAIRVEREWLVSYKARGDFKAVRESGAHIGPELVREMQASQE